jgi:hypothetical protein
VVKVKETQLDALYEFDNALLGEVAKISEAVAKVAAALQIKQGVVEAIANCVTVAQDANYTFGHREEVILQGKAPQNPLQRTQ